MDKINFKIVNSVLWVFAVIAIVVLIGAVSKIQYENTTLIYENAQLQKEFKKARELKVGDKFQFEVSSGATVLCTVTDYNLDCNLKGQK